MKNCVFCKIVSGELPADVIYEDKEVVAFRDIKPQAPVHILVIPRRHFESAMDMSEKSPELAGHMVNTSVRLAVAAGIAGKGFRLVTNSGIEGGQVVGHLHWHILGGRQLSGDLG